MWPPDNGMRQSGKLQPRRFWQRYPWQIATAISLLLVVIFVSTTIYFATRRPPQNAPIVIASSTPTQAATLQPTLASTPTPLPQTPTVGVTPTPIPATPTKVVGSPLCSADASTQWSGWTGTADWKIFNNMLINDGSNGSYQTAPTIIAPCQLDTVSDYAVEMRMQMVRGNNCVDITTRGTATGGDWQGYKASVCNGNVQITSSNGDTLTQASFDPTTAWHVYRFEVKGASLKLFVDNGLLLTTSDNRYLMGSQVGIKSFSTQVNISSYKVLQL